jgi:hypothetical protein
MNKILWAAIAVFVSMMLGIALSYAATVRSSDGRTARVSSAFQPHAQCFINKLNPFISGLSSFLGVVPSPRMICKHRFD